MKIISAQGDEAGFSVVTEEAGHMLFTSSSNPAAFEDLQRWIAAGNTVEPRPTAESLFTRLSKAELWRRCTDAEAEALALALSQAPLRLQMVFQAAQFLDTNDPDYPAMREGVIAALGLVRANAVLKPES
ncbi:MAG: hypothetical protein O9972_13085 [Burkholderiales bacterium]|nr:hypothetical protein [Burkholderiales bacterium]